MDEVLIKHNTVVGDIWNTEFFHILSKMVFFYLSFSFKT